MGITSVGSDTSLARLGLWLQWPSQNEQPLLCSGSCAAPCTVLVQPRAQLPGELEVRSSGKRACGMGKRDGRFFSSSVMQLELAGSHPGISVMERDSPAALSAEELETELRIWSGGSSFAEMSYSLNRFIVAMSSEFLRLDCELRLLNRPWN